MNPLCCPVCKRPLVVSMNEPGVCAHCGWTGWWWEGKKITELVDVAQPPDVDQFDVLERAMREYSTIPDFQIEVEPWPDSDAARLDALERIAQQISSLHFQIKLLIGPDGILDMTTLSDTALEHLQALLLVMTPLPREVLDWDPDALRQAVEVELARRKP